MKHLGPFLSLLLIPLLIVLPVQAQLPAVQPDHALRVLLKNPAIATVSSQSAAGFLVEVTDAQGAPVPDAAVAFRLPDTEPTGTFADGSHAAVAYTDASGHAHSPAIRWGVMPGSANLRITAAKGALHAGLLLEQILQPSAPAPASSAAPISAPQVVIVPVPEPTLPNPPTAANPPALDPPAFHPSIPSPAASKATDLTKSGASPAPVPVAKPEVSITNNPAARPHSNKKWLIIALVAVGVGVGAAMAMKGKGAATTSTPAATPPIGTPTVTIGH